MKMLFLFLQIAAALALFEAATSLTLAGKLNSLTTLDQFDQAATFIVDNLSFLVADWHRIQFKVNYFYGTTL